jgi:hypothetical protein
MGLLIGTSSKIEDSSELLSPNERSYLWNQMNQAEKAKTSGFDWLSKMKKK